MTAIELKLVFFYIDQAEEPMMKKKEKQKKEAKGLYNIYTLPV